VFEISRHPRSQRLRQRLWALLLLAVVVAFFSAWFMKYLVPAFVVATLLVGALGALYGPMNARKRRKAMERIAKRLGLKFTSAPRTRGLPGVRGLYRLGLFQSGDKRKLLNVMNGRVEGIRVTVFDYSFEIGGAMGGNSETHRQTVCAVYDEGLDLPYFELKPAGAWAKLCTMAGFEDIGVAESARFSAQYVLSGKDEPEIRTAFTTEVLGFFETCPWMHVQGGGDTIIFTHTGGLLEVKEVEALLMDGIRGLVAFGAKK